MKKREDEEDFVRGEGGELVRVVVGRHFHARARRWTGGTKLNQLNGMNGGMDGEGLIIDSSEFNYKWMGHDYEQEWNQTRPLVGKLATVIQGTAGRQNWANILKRSIKGNCQVKKLLFVDCPSTNQKWNNNHDIVFSSRRKCWKYRIRSRGKYVQYLSGWGLTQTDVKDTLPLGLHVLLSNRFGHPPIPGSPDPQDRLNVGRASQSASWID